VQDPNEMSSLQIEDDGRVDMAALELEVSRISDLNQAVHQLLAKPLGEEDSREVKRRQRKGKLQLGLLEEEYKRNAKWNR